MHELMQLCNDLYYSEQTIHPILNILIFVHNLDAYCLALSISSTDLCRLAFRLSMISDIFSKQSNANMCYVYIEQILRLFVFVVEWKLKLICECLHFLKFGDHR